MQIVVLDGYTLNPGDLSWDALEALGTCTIHDRGPLVDEPALAEALNSGRIAGAGLDVLSVEPPGADNPLLCAKNCYISPHHAWATKAARQRLLATVVENVKAFIDGRPQNVVNP